MPLILFHCFFLLFLSACQSSLPKPYEIPTISNEDINIQNNFEPNPQDSNLTPISVDTSSKRMEKPNSRKAILILEKEEFDFGNIPNDSLLHFYLNFKNIGNKALEIHGIESPCDCINSDFPSYLIAAGENDSLQITLNPKSQKGKQNTSIKILSNNDSTNHIIEIKYSIQAK